MDQDRDIVGLLAEVIREETMFLRHYIGQVFNNVDPLRKGRVLALIPELGFDTPDSGMWCFPRQSSSMVVPEIGDYVEVYFMAGDPNRPVFIYPACEMADMVPSNFNGLPTSKVIFQSKKTGEGIKYQELLLQLDLIATFIRLNEGTEPFVKGNVLLTFLGNLITALNLHTHTGVTVGAGVTGVPSAPFTAPTGNEVSLEIFGK